MADAYKPPEEPAGELVETGTFRVDRERMLQVLSAYQLPGGEAILAAWVRCAAASGAKTVSLESLPSGSGSGFDFVFDGRPFTREELQDIYAPLMDGRQGRGAFFAAGTLALLRTRPRCVHVSAPGTSLTITGLLEQTPGPDQGATKNILRVVWDKPPEDRFLSLLPYGEIPGTALSRLAIAAPGRDTLNWDKTLGKFPGAAFFDEGGRRGLIWPKLHELTPMTGFHPEQDSDISVFTLGVLLERRAERLPLAPVNISVNDDGLRLDASLSGCVADEKYEALKAFIQKQAEDLVLTEIAEQRRALAAVGERLHIPRYAELWRAKMKWAEAWQAATSDWRDVYLPDFLKKYFKAAVPVPQEAYAFGPAGDRYFWLQDACRRAHKNGAAAGKVVRSELWRAPLLLSNHGVPLSLERVIKLCESDGLLPVTRKTAAEGSGVIKAVWLASFRDERFLNDWVPKEKWLWV